MFNIFVSEAKWIFETLNQFTKLTELEILNIGSSTHKFREYDQPWINKYVFNQLKVRGAKVTHADIKIDEGIDVVIDLINLNDMSSLNQEYDVIIASNILEHVESIDLAIKNLQILCKKGGLLIVTGPTIYPYHPDPIDNLFRPNKSELLYMFQTCELLKFASLKNFNSAAAVIDGNLFIKIFSTVNLFVKILIFQKKQDRVRLIKLKFCSRVEAYAAIFKVS